MEDFEEKEEGLEEPMSFDGGDSSDIEDEEGDEETEDDFDFGGEDDLDLGEEE